MSQNKSIYQDIAERTGGDVYIGVVGPVRSGKSTFIKRFMENSVIPNITSDSERERANDEMPQSATGKTVMTTQPTFVPENAVEISVGEGLNMKVKLIDCVGFIIDGAEGISTENGPRMVNTPWSDTPMEFQAAAEIGTRKVINEHSTVGIVITTDGTVGELPRENYIKAEEKVIDEMKTTGKPFVVIMNTKLPESDEVSNLCEHLSFKYGIPVIPKNCYQLTEDEIQEILGRIVLEFPIKEIDLKIPEWIVLLDNSDTAKSSIMNLIEEKFGNITKTSQISEIINSFNDDEYIKGAKLDDSDLGKGAFNVSVDLKEGLFYRILGTKCKLSINSEGEIMEMMTLLSEIKEKYEKIKNALDSAESKGYGIVVPSVEDMTLEEPEIVKKSGSYGVKLKASAPSLHIIKAPITAEISPIVGSEKQSEDMVKFLLEEFEDDPKKIWESNMFGKSLYDLVNEGLNAKLENIPDESREKIADTLKKIVNDGPGGIICIVL